MAGILPRHASPRFGSYVPHDVAIVGAGPVGLAIGLELARMGLDVIVLDRRPPPADDPSLRPQLLVARRSDLANLAHLGLPIWDRHLVSPIVERHHLDVTNGRSRCIQVDHRDHGPRPLSDWGDIVGQPPVALVPIGRLQQALAELAAQAGATLVYEARVTSIKRHRPLASLHTDNGVSVRAKLVVVSTGAARSLVPAACAPRLVSGHTRRLIGGVFAVSGDAGRWTRAEIPHRGDVVRCTALATGPETRAGTALIVDAPLRVDPTPALLDTYFALAADTVGIGGGFLVEPRSFETAITGVTKRFVGGDGRAPIVVAGDAAQTGHVFSGLVGFVNLGLGLELCEHLRAAKRAIANGSLNSTGLLSPMNRYQRQSAHAATLLHQVSQRHFARAPAGRWVL